MRWGCSCIPTRLASCTARTARGVVRTSTPRSRSWGTGSACGRSGRGTGILLRLQPGRQQRGRQAHGPGDPLLAAAPAQWMEPRRNSHGRSTGPCKGGSTTTGGSTVGVASPASAGINDYLVRWACRKYKRSPPGNGSARREWLAETRKTISPSCSLTGGSVTSGWLDDGSRVNREVYAGSERAGG